MKYLGAILLAAGFLGGAYVTVSQIDSVHWGFYSACAAAMVLGIIVSHLARSADSELSGEKHEADIATLKVSLSDLIDKVKGFETKTADEDQLEVHRRIDLELLGDINAFVEARESMIPKLGMQRYADIMSPFANGERLINRAWSASADGYVDEVRDCIAAARVQLEKAQELLASS